MRIAVISDIHGNLEALVRCLDDIERSGVDRIVNLGDAIGYGPQPEEVLVLLEKKGIPNILGNHELAVTDRDFRNDFSPQAIISLEQTLKYLTSASLLYIKNLPYYREMEGALMVHGCPPDSPTFYLNHMSRSEIREAFVSDSFDIAFAGHTHRRMLMRYDGEDLTFDPLRQEVTPLKQGFRYIVNVGAVGQPRDGDPLAKYAIWDNRRKTLEIRRVAYDISRTADLIIKRGFLRRDADRLYTGDAPGPHQVYRLASCDR
jgi:predicted phosphodiesterase